MEETQAFTYQFWGIICQSIFKEYTAKGNIEWKRSTSYIPQQIDKAKRFNYTLISLGCLFLLGIYLLKTLQDELIKTVTYIKNYTPDINTITSCKPNNPIFLNHSYIKFVGSQA